MNSPGNISMFFLVLLLCVSSVLYYSKAKAENELNNNLEIILSSDASTTSLAIRNKEENCTINGPLPDSSCTPGSVFTDKTLTEICVPGYTKTVRDVPDKLRKEIYLSYGTTPGPRGSYELDHLIPLAIGGDNSISNLWPESATPSPGFKEKDLVEVYLREEVCAGRVSITVAQSRVASNWLEIYNNLSSQTISHLKSLYKNWSN